MVIVGIESLRSIHLPLWMLPPDGSHSCSHQLPPVPQDADLVTLEFAVNEKPDAPYPSPERRAFEQLLRRLLRLPGR